MSLYLRDFISPNELVLIRVLETLQDLQIIQNHLESLTSLTIKQLQLLTCVRAAICNFKEEINKLHLGLNAYVTPIVTSSETL